MPITRSWRRSPRSASCAPRSSWNRDPDTASRPERERAISKTSDGQSTTYKITLPKLEAAKFDAALGSHRDTLISQWKRDRDDHRDEDPYADVDPDAARMTDLAVPMPTTTDAFMSLVDAGWDTDVAARPHGQHTTVIAHVNVADRVAGLHLGPLLSDAERQYLTCDATCEVWFEAHGRPIGAGRSTRTVNRRLRRALEHRDRCCVVPGCGATRGLHAHHIGTGKTAAKPNSPTWFWSVRITTGCITAASSPSPDPPTTWSSPTATGMYSPMARWPDHRPHPRRPCRPTQDPAANAPTGGGTTPSNPNHHQTTTDRRVSGLVAAECVSSHHRVISSRALVPTGSVTGRRGLLGDCTALERFTIPAAPFSWRPIRKCSAGIHATARGDRALCIAE